VAIVTECGAFGDNGTLDFAKTEFDFEIDQISNHPGVYTLVFYVAFKVLRVFVCKQLIDFKLIIQSHLPCTFSFGIRDYSSYHIVCLSCVCKFAS